MQRQHFHDVLMQLPAQVAISRGPDHVFDLVNTPYQQLFLTRPMQGLPVREALPELVGQQFIKTLDRVYQTGEPFYSRAMPTSMDFINSGHLEVRYVDVFFQTLHNAQGHIDGILNFSYDVTAQVLAHQQVEQLNQLTQAARAEAERARAQLQALLAQAPVAIGLLTGDDLRVAAANAEMAAIWGCLPAQVVGRPLLEGVPELQGQGFDDLLRQVLHTQMPVTGRETPAQMLRDGQLQTTYYNFLEAYQQLSLPQQMTVVVVMLTTSVSPRNQQRATHLPVAAYLPKPFAANCILTPIINRIPRIKPLPK